ncbi:peptidyl-prolyl cis-trans isomerase B (cyclophilin B) [bacterium A37T11]|nr:peptidyl-prolyl cis-trans isomerase B (cyclophilin B) [bacterium A37T11]
MKSHIHRYHLIVARAFLLLIIGQATVSAQQRVRLETPYGSCIIRLYDETPQHRDNFLKLVKEGYFNKTSFHRIIRNFVSQGGDPDSLYLNAASLKPEQFWMDPEIHSNLFHKKGVLAAGRDDNPGKRSFSTQIYLVQGHTWTDGQMDSLENTPRLKGHKIPQAQREVYKTIGGIPFLDQGYTVFGEIEKGISLVDKLGSLPTDRTDKPLAPVPITLKVIE